MSANITSTKRTDMTATPTPDQGATERARVLLRDLEENAEKIVAATITAAVAEARAAPVPMILFCPACGIQHVDADNPNWDNPPHKTHRCESCGHLWRPTEIVTEGVADLPIGTSDTRPAIRRQTEAQAAERIEAIEDCATVAHKFGDVEITDAIRALAAPAQSPCCIITKNQCGTDTWAFGQACLCVNCQAYLRTNPDPRFPPAQSETP